MLDVSGEQTYPSQAQKIDQFELPVVDWELRDRLRHGQEELMLGLDLEGQSLSFQDVFVSYVFHVVASHPMPVKQLLDQPRGPLHLPLPERPGGLFSWYERGIVAEPSHYGFCSAVVLSAQVMILGGRALDVVEGFIFRVLRFLVEMLDGFWSAGKSVIASALASSQFTEEGSFVDALLLLSSDPSTDMRFALRSEVSSSHALFWDCSLFWSRVLVSTMMERLSVEPTLASLTRGMTSTI